MVRSTLLPRASARSPRAAVRTGRRAQAVHLAVFQRYRDGSIDMGTGYDCVDSLSHPGADVGVRSSLLRFFRLLRLESTQIYEILFAAGGAFILDQVFLGYKERSGFPIVADRSF
jgi:hypothetical protein